MRFLIIFIFLIANAKAVEPPKIKNLVINKEYKVYEDISFLDSNRKITNLADYKGKLVLINFWATWCAPCKEEMPSLDALKINPNLKDLVIFPVNIGKDNLRKSRIFFEDLGIKNLDIYFDNPMTLAKKFNLRGVPTTILFNKENKEFARVIGSIDFTDENFLNWIKQYN
ncbi:TlpA family protein disulfide reductase [Candidatus Pelagibacter communis]|uniref:TlpA family protein disulfide reductase n=1 Tax=Pelagibacter ubique TaxID=198252 RepID=UPI00094D4004|nr:TlpA disulfide reductase family protein [Candidatus Pelagibacter ubique]|tara:strand:+ start:302 stop:811 length:510 start_codon:yes stop_codon:yes gene_type:complete